MAPTSLLPSFLAVLLATARAATAAPAAAQCAASETRYSIIDLGTVGGIFSYAVDVDNAGRAVGGSWTAEGHLHPFLLQDGVMTDLGTLGGVSGSSGGVRSRVPLLGRGRWVERPTLGGVDRRGFDINDLGQVVGISSSSDTRLFFGGSLRSDSGA